MYSVNWILVDENGDIGGGRQLAGRIPCLEAAERLLLHAAEWALELGETEGEVCVLDQNGAIARDVDGNELRMPVTVPAHS